MQSLQNIQQSSLLRNYGERGSSDSDNHTNEIISLSPKAYWKFDTTDVLHDELDNHNGTFTGTITLNDGAVEVETQGKSVNFDGSTGYAEVDNHADLQIETGNKFSVACWVKFDSFDNNILPRLWEKRPHFACLMGDSENAKYRKIALEVANSTGEGNDNGGVTEFWADDTVLELDTWYHVVITFDGSQEDNQANIYINGIAETVDIIYPWPAAPNNVMASTSTRNWMVARRHPDLTRNLDGNLDEMAVFQNKVLTATEVRDLYESSVTLQTNLEFDSTAASTISNTATSKSFNVASTGTNRAITVAAMARDTTTADRVVSSVVRGGQSFSFVEAIDDAGDRVRVELWKLENPRLGTYSTTVTWAGSNDTAAAASASFKGANQTNCIDVSDSATASSAAPSVTLTTTAANTILVDAGIQDSGSAVLTKEAAQTERWQLSGSRKAFGSTKAVESAGEATMSWSSTVSAAWVSAVAAIKGAS